MNSGQMTRRGTSQGALRGAYAAAQGEPAPAGHVSVKRAEGVDLDRRRLRRAKQLGADCVNEVPAFGANKFQDISPVMTAREVEEKLPTAGLKQLAGDVERAGITLLLEPCNRKETHFMNRQSQTAEIIDAVAAPGFRILSYFYHMQLEEKDIGETLGRVSGRRRSGAMRDG